MNTAMQVFFCDFNGAQIAENDVFQRLLYNSVFYFNAETES